VTGLGEHSNEPVCFLKCRKFLDLQKTNKLCKTTPMELFKDSNSCVTTGRHLIFNMVTDISYTNVLLSEQM
jgi:hypothetical protein